MCIRDSGNVIYEDALMKAEEEVKNGKTLSSVIEANPIFPPIVSQMLSVGEETGQTDKILVKVAEFYEEEVDQITKNMSSIIEPLLMVVIGGGVGFFAVAMLQPMYSMMDNVK